MDVRRLGLLRELADRGSVTAVAQALHLTPSAVSQQLKALEREAGIALTERSGRGIVLTAPGRVLAHTAQDIAVAIERAEATWSEFVEQPRGTVTLNLFPSAGEMLLPALLGRVDAIPGLELVCFDADPATADFTDLVANRDLVVADAPGILPEWRDRRLSIIELLREPLDVALRADHPLAARDELTPTEIIGERWIGVPDDGPFDRILRRIEAITGRPADVDQRIIDNGIVEALVAAGRGIAILPRFTTRARENGLVTRPLVGIRSERVIWALSRPDVAVRPSVRLVAEELRAVAASYLAVQP